MQELPWEDALLERKVESDLKDLLKTVVAFANSVRPGHTAVILIGERDDGTAQGVTDPNKIQKTVRATCEKIYPAIVWRSQVYEKDGKYCVRVEIEFSGETPHFGGAAWVRRGSETVKASDEVFQRLIELRLSKVQVLAKWLGKQVSVVNRQEHPGQAASETMWVGGVVIAECNQFWVTFKQSAGAQFSFPLSRVEINLTMKVRGCVWS